MTTLIVGGGLSGLALAHMLETHGHDYLLVEARARFGGRIETKHLNGSHFDMGPTWFWPGQPRIAALIDQFGLEKFDQFSQGALMYENERGQVQQNRGFSSMQGSWRLKGGLAALIQALEDSVAERRKRLNFEVRSLGQEGGGITATSTDGDTVAAHTAVLALPPRIAAQLTYSPALPVAGNEALRAVPTWMAGQSKAVAVYQTPFWRDAGLSGDATSRYGPMVEIHDASPAMGDLYALFGFIGVPPAARTDQSALRQQVLAQLVRLFGPQAAVPVDLYFKDWAADPHTCTDADAAPLYAHPTYGMPNAIRNLWEGKLHFAGSEVASRFGGYLEGALEAAEGVFEAIVNRNA